MLNDNFDTFDTSTWYVSDFAVAANWNQTAWDENYVLTPPGEVVLTFDGTDTSGKPYTGSEIQSNAFNGYGSYEVDMMPSGESGVVSSFFLFSNTFFGAARHNEIDFEFLGDDTTKVNINYYYGNEKLYRIILSKRNLGLRIFLFQHFYNFYSTNFNIHNQKNIIHSY